MLRIEKFIADQQCLQEIGGLFEICSWQHHVLNQRFDRCLHLIENRFVHLHISAQAPQVHELRVGEATTCQNGLIEECCARPVPILRLITAARSLKYSWHDR